MKINKDTLIGDTGYSLRNLLPYELYNNTSGGTTSNITLNDNIMNYKYLEIYYRSNDGGGFKNFVKVDVTGDIVTSLRYDHYYIGTVYSKIAEISISNKNLVFYSNIQTYHGDGNGVTINHSGDFIYIYKVLGYK